MATTGLDLASNAVSTGGNIALGLVQNEGERIKAQYQRDLQELLNDASLSKAEFQVKLTALNAQRDAAVDAYKAASRKDYLTYGLVGLVVVGLFVLALRLLARKRNRE